ncbi:MAG TPA: SusC/RagA family TonB-linked outer membrane protein [Bacteroidales bacterium]|nr:SusC/RagA family TonB-linked outer membrane protein [Bacteroidales bacterium]
MRKFTLLIVILLFTGLQVAFAQQKTITGKVTSKDDGTTLPGVTVVVKGTTIGTVTDINGKYTILVPPKYDVIVFSFVGMKSQEVKVTASSTIDIVMESDIMNIEGVVVTALGIPREKKSLGYSTQEVKGDQVSVVKTDNFINALSGKVSGVQIKKTTNMGGSTNVLLRGSKSLTGENQTLFVVDGVPVNNSNFNTSSQSQGGIGYDFGNMASDINPDDIESINVLKGAAATALYGSRAAGGVIMITTKKGGASGTGGVEVKKKGIGITINSGVTMGFVDKSTFPKYQKEYGAGYGDYWTETDFDGDGVPEIWSNVIDDASYGPAFDPDLLVYQWNAVDPESPYYFTQTPWVAAENGPITFFEKPLTFTNSVSLENSSNKGSYRLSYTNYTQKGLMPNSKLNKDNVLLNGAWNVSDKLTVSGSANYTSTRALGRNSTGYSDNLVTSFRQWMETNVDIQQQREMYELTGRNITWNYADPTDPQPIYWDNYYWTRYQNYENDNRNRFLGYMAVDYKVLKWLSLFGRFSADTYNELQEERRAVGSIATPFGIGTGSDGSLGRAEQKSGYLRRDITFSEYNFDLMGNVNKDFGQNWNLKGIVGLNVRRTNYNRLISATNGGLAVPGLYSLQNSVGPLPLSKELASKVGVNGIYASASLGYKSIIYLDGTIRRDHSSTLPIEHSVYYYPSVATSFVFSNLIPENKVLSYGKIRVNYAMVGNSASFDQLTDNYNIVTPMNAPITSVAGTKKNSDLLPEKTRSFETGLEMFFFGRRIGFDVAYYNSNTSNQILPLAVSTSTGYTYKIINAGQIENKGVELSLMATPVKGKKFQWNITLNWAKNWNKVLSLAEGVENLQLGSYQGGITVNARVGQPYGVICGTDYVTVNGNPVGESDSARCINPANGRYYKTATSDNVLGNVNPDWTGGILNSLTYGNWNFSFLIDVSKGGEIFSLDMYYGLATGLYEETAGLNDLGNPVRDPIVWVDPADHSLGYASNSGGVINEGVNPDGSENVTRINAGAYGAFGYVRNPDKAFVYDATFVKLREVSLSYNLPTKWFQKSFITGLALSAVASNPWIIYKKLPYADPESGLGAGNLQGYSVGSLPATRDFSFNVKLTF